MLYVEAFPRLVATDSLSKWNRGKPHCGWRNELGHVVGRGYVNWASPTSLTFAYDLQKRADVEAAQGHIFLEARYRVSRYSSKVSLVCPKCDRSRHVLAIIGSGMSCAACAGLRNKSSVLPPYVRAREKLFYIDAIIAHGRPRNMKQSIYQDLLESRRIIVARFLGIEHTNFSPLPVYERAEWRADLIPGF